MEFRRDYRVEAPIGRGGFSTVHLCQHKGSLKQYAVKIIEKRLIKEDWRIQNQILKEVEIHRELHHDNIVPLKEVYESESRVYLVMKVLVGGSLVN